MRYPKYDLSARLDLPFTHMSRRERKAVMRSSSHTSLFTWKQWEMISFFHAKQLEGPSLLSHGWTQKAEELSVEKNSR
jgi:hypothetical protein